MSVFDYLDQEPGAPPQPRMSDLWEFARDDYFAGESADVVCERHKLSRSQFFERARREGWLRRDQPRKAAEPIYNAEEEEAFVEEALGRAPPAAYALYRRAWARAERAILMGRRVEAAGWTRLARDLRGLALEEERLSWPRIAKAREPDFPDSPSTRPPSSPSSPAQAGAQVRPASMGTEPSPPPAPAPTWAPACAGEVARGEPDSPDSPPAKPSPTPLNRQERRRLAKLGPLRLAEIPRPGFRSGDAAAPG